MILSTINQAHRFLPSLNLTLENHRFTDFFARAQAWLTSRVIGEDIETVLESYMGPVDDDPSTDLFTLCQRVIAEKALLDAIPEMDMQLTEAGFAVQNNDDFAPASSQRVDRLMATLPERIATDVDAIVRFLTKNSNTDEAPFRNWRGSEQYSYLTEAFIPLFDQYNKLSIPPAKAYDEFYAAIPTMAREMQKVAAYYVSKQEVCRLRELFRDGEALQVHRQAIAELKTVAVAAYHKDMTTARNAAVCARDIMLASPDSFPMFKASDAFTLETVNLDGGRMVNFL